MGVCGIDHCVSRRFDPITPRPAVRRTRRCSGPPVSRRCFVVVGVCSSEEEPAASRSASLLTRSSKLSVTRMFLTTRVTDDEKAQNGAYVFDTPNTGRSLWRSTEVIVEAPLRPS